MLQNGFLKTVNGVFIVGVRVEGKGMKTKAEVKNYLTEIKQDNSKVRGYYMVKYRLQ
jgi:hypothetical protein